jgi:long-chain acyl-CoA synthetase
VLTKEAFSVENNILTPTFKLKRHVAREFFKVQIEAMYKSLEQKGIV